MKAGSRIISMWWPIVLSVGIAFVWWVQRLMRAADSDPATLHAPIRPPEKQATESAPLPGESDSPVDVPLRPFDAARIIGCEPQEVSALLADRPATLQHVEQLAAEHYRWRRHLNDPDSYWVTAKQAAEILDVSVQRVKQLLDDDQLPHALHCSGVRLMRREQLETVANGRPARRS